MSVMPEQQLPVESASTAVAEKDVLVFAAASLVREMNSGVNGRPVREVVSEDRRYRLEGHRLQAPGTAGGPIVLVFVEPLAESLPHDDVLRSRFGLTKNEVRVAKLIAEDLSNDEIADRLCISPHTARHHTERILSKLGVRSRTLVRRALMQAESAS